jgi:hypothetical protein
VTALTAADSALLVVAGLGAGFVNGVAGGGSLVSFPALLAVGYPPLTANVTSTVGIWPGYLGGVAGYRGVLTGQRHRVRQLLPVTLAGALAGAALLLVLPGRSFAAAAPWLILLGCLLFAVQPLVAKVMRARRPDGVAGATAGGAAEDGAAGATVGTAVDGTAVDGERSPSAAGRAGLAVGVLLASAYGSYFGAGLGVILLGVLGLGLPDRLVRVNGLRSVLALLVNTVALAVFALRAPVVWPAAGLMAASSLLGGFVGARVAQRIPAVLLRVAVIGLGLVSAVTLLLR